MKDSPEAPEDRIRQLDEKWSGFCSRAAHELRTPLSSILMLAEMLAESPSGDLGERERGQARKVRQATTDVLGLLAEFSELAKIEGERLQVEVHDVALAELARQLEKDFRPLAQEKGLAFEVEVAEDVPASIRSDRRCLEKIVRSLLTNAFDSTREGGVEVRVTRQVAIVVSDSGESVPEEQWETFFEPLRHANARTRREHGGQGLSLAIAEALARLLGGELTLTGREGGGSVFTLRIRAARQPGSATRRPPGSERLRGRATAPGA